MPNLFQRLAGLAALASTAALSPGCGAPAANGGHAAGETPSIVVVDDVGREVRLAKPASRAVSLIPAFTELIMALGAGDRLVARTDYDRDPALAHLPSVGGGLTPSIEWLLTLEPELVVAWPDQMTRAVAQRLEALGVPVYTARPERLADAFRAARDLGRMLGLETEAETLVSAIEAELDEVRAATAGRQPTEVLYLVGVDPPRAAAAGTFIHELIEAAGGRNIFADARGWPEVSVEAVVRRQPAVVFVAQGEDRSGAVERLRRRPGWRALEAVRAGRIVELDPSFFNRPGPSMAAAARELAAILHGDAVAPLGSAKETAP